MMMDATNRSIRNSVEMHDTCRSSSVHVDLLCHVEVFHSIVKSSCEPSWHWTWTWLVLSRVWVLRIRIWFYLYRSSDYTLMIITKPN